jgi:hypothetical protein
MNWVAALIIMMIVLITFDVINNNGKGEI